MKTVIEMANECRLLDGLSISPSQAVRYAALVEAAYIERLLAGVEMPEPQDSGYAVDGIEIQTLSYIQMHEFAASAVARKDAKIEQLKDKLDSSVHGHNQIFELCQVLETERDALKVEVKRLTEERESWRRVCEKITTERDALKAEVERLKTAVADEREACANAVLKIANDDAGNPYKQALRMGAEAIRARGNT